MMETVNLDVSLEGDMFKNSGSPCHNITDISSLVYNLVNFAASKMQLFVASRSQNKQKWKTEKKDFIPLKILRVQIKNQLEKLPVHRCGLSHLLLII